MRSKPGIHIEAAYRSKPGIHIEAAYRSKPSIHIEVAYRSKPGIHTEAAYGPSHSVPLPTAAFSAVAVAADVSLAGRVSYTD